MRRAGMALWGLVTALLLSMIGLGIAPASADYPDPDPITLTVTVDGNRVCASVNGIGTITIELLGQVVSGEAPEFCAEFDLPPYCDTTTVTGTVTFVGRPAALGGGAGGLSASAFGTQQTITTPFTMTVQGTPGPDCIDDEDDSASGPGGILPQTGAELAWWILAIAIVLLLAGSGALLISRRR